MTKWYARAQPQHRTRATSLTSHRHPTCAVTCVGERWEMREDEGGVEHTVLKAWETPRVTARASGSGRAAKPAGLRGMGSSTLVVSQATTQPVSETHSPSLSLLGTTA